MATIVKTSSGTWKALIRKTGWPATAKTFRTKRDAEDWARRTEDEMVRGVYIQRAPAERMTVAAALTRYLKEVTPTKRASTQAGEHKKAQVIIRHLGKYSLAALNAEIVAQFRDTRLAGDVDENGKLRPRSNNTVRLELALLGHLFTVAIKEWGIGLPFNPVSNIRRPAPGSGRNRRLTPEEQTRLLQAVDKHSNPMFGWIVRIAVQTGMRLSEIATLRIRQVDIERRVVRLEHTKNSSPRTVPLTAEATRVFTEALANPLRLAEPEHRIMPVDGTHDGSRGWCGPQPNGRGHGPLTRQKCTHAVLGVGVQGQRPVTLPPRLPPARVESPERQSLFGKYPSSYKAGLAEKSGKPIGRQKTRQFLREAFLPAFSVKPKKPTPCKIALPKARETAMAEMGTRETELSKTISDAERDRRVAAVNYARASVGLEGFSLSATDEAHAQYFIDGEISLNEFVRPRGSLEHSKT